MPRRIKTKEELKRRFWSKVEIKNPSECWPWKRARTIRGYGSFCLNSKNLNAQRALWIIEFGPIADGLCVCHKCDNPPCCNPDHLFLGTDADNMTDKTRKGRNNPAVGERGGFAKLTTEQVLEIRKVYSEGLENQTQLGTRFGVNKRTIQKIVNFQRWKHLPVCA